MVNVGLFGVIKAGHEEILDLFVKYYEAGRLTQIDPVLNCKIKKVVFPEDDDHFPRRVLFRDEIEHKDHGLFVPRGDFTNSVDKMGIITVSRIARKVIAVFDMTKDLKYQFKFFQSLKLYPRSFTVCLSRVEQFDSEHREEIIGSFKSNITQFFNSRRIRIDKFFPVIVELQHPDSEFRQYNDAAVKMILDVTVGGLGDDINNLDLPPRPSPHQKQKV